MRVYGVLSAMLLLLSSIVLATVFLPEGTCAYTTHDPIYISGNEDFTIENGVTSGDGTSSSPYIIESLTIPVESGHGIYIGNTDAYFIIRDVEVVGSGIAATWGIGLSGLSNGSILNCNLQNHYGSISADNSWDVVVGLNTLDCFNHSGIHLMRCGRWQISGNVIESSVESWRGISVSDTTQVTISNNSITHIRNDNELGFGIEAWIADNITVKGNLIADCDAGIALPLTNDSLVTQNDLIDNSKQGFSSYSYTTSWNLSYPDGGNYWSDYAGLDLMNGPLQDIPGPDGIGDTPYVILDMVSPRVQDAYPLMEPNGSNRPPVALFEVTSDEFKQPLLFDSSSSWDYEDLPSELMIRWDWEDDGNWDTDWSYNRSASHSYSSIGSYTVRLQVIDTDERIGEGISIIEISEGYDDFFPPETVVNVSGIEGENGWYTSHITIEFVAHDGLSQINWTKYRIDDSDEISYEQPFAIDYDGTIELSFYSQDTAGNSEETHTITVSTDCTNPIVEMQIEEGASFKPDMTIISWICSDSCSGVDRVEYKLDTGPFVLCPDLTQVQLFNLTEGKHVITIAVFDEAGNWIAHDFEFTVENSPPSALSNPLAIAAIVSVMGGCVVLALFIRKRRQ